MNTADVTNIAITAIINPHNAKFGGMGVGKALSKYTRPARNSIGKYPMRLAMKTTSQYPLLKPSVFTLPKKFDELEGSTLMILELK